MILITGLDYSGTSATAGLLYHLGVNMGEWQHDVPLETQSVQDLFISYGGHPRPYLTYEDTIVEHEISEAIAHNIVHDSPAHKKIFDAILNYQHRHAANPRPLGLKNNACCAIWALLSSYTLILTHRNEEERNVSQRYYLGSLENLLRHWPHIMISGYQKLLPQARYVVEFTTLVTQPETIITNLIKTCALTPTRSQYNTALASIVRRPLWAMQPQPQLSLLP